MSIFSRSWRLLINGGVPRQASLQQIRRTYLVNVVTIVGSTTLLIFGIIDFNRFPTVSLTELIGGIVLVLAGLLLRLTRHLFVPTQLVLLTLLALIIMILLTGRGDGAWIVWVAVFPPVIFFLTEKYLGVVWVGLLLGIEIGLYLTSHTAQYYTHALMQHSIYSVVVVSLIVYFYQDIVRITLKDLEISNKHLTSSNLELTEAKNNIEQQVRERTHELTAEHARLEASINSLPLGLIMTNANGHVLSYNAAVRKLLSPSSNKSNDFSDNAPPQQLLKSLQLDEHMKAAASQSKTISLPVRQLHGKYFQVVVSPIVNPGISEIIGMVIIIQDMTEEHIVQRSKDEFLADASHELRTPLTIIQGNLSLLKQVHAAEINNPKLLHIVDTIYDATSQLNSLVNHFLQITSLELGEVELQHDQFDIVDLTADVMDNYQQAANVKSIKLGFSNNTRPNPARAVADREKIKQILSNLVSNALRFTKQGSVQVDITQTDTTATIKVIDTGEGMDEDQQQLLFRKFQQATELMHRDTSPSSGLGLYISKLLIEKMGGKIYLVKSEPHRGSTFALELPISHAA